MTNIRTYTNERKTEEEEAEREERAEEQEHCPECGGRLVSDAEHAETVCEDCGLV
ncbi:transcription initiation factor IIB, partial [Halobiforma lacisalsi AJ5]